MSLFQRQIDGYLYIKVEDETEDYSEIKPAFEQKKRLKSLKVISNGYKIGEMKK